MALISERLRALDSIVSVAAAIELRGGVNAEIMTADCILASNWLRFAPQNNCFKILAYKEAQGRQRLIHRRWFTAKSLAEFLAEGDNRWAAPIKPGCTDARQEYHCYDWFATFDSLQSCLEKQNENLIESAPHKSHKIDELAYAMQAINSLYNDPTRVSKLAAILRMAEVGIALAGRVESV